MDGNLFLLGRVRGSAGVFHESFRAMVCCAFGVSIRLGACAYWADAHAGICVGCRGFACGGLRGASGCARVGVDGCRSIARGRAP